VLGNIRFSGTQNVSGLSGGPIPGPGPYAVSGGGSVFGAVVDNDPLATSAINYVNSLSQTLGLEAGTDLTLTSSQTIRASNGILDGDGNRVFDTTSVDLNNTSTLIIQGSPFQSVVINVTDNDPTFNGQIYLSGGIAVDQVLFNMVGGNYTTHSGGPTLTISTNGQITNGVFLDPNGSMQLNNGQLFGRFFGGGATDAQIISGNIGPSPVGGSFRGDMNGDTFVDGVDLELFLYGLTNRDTAKFFAKCESISGPGATCDLTPQEGGDFSGNGRLDFDDIAIFRNENPFLFQSIPSAGLMSVIDRNLSPVPEPNSGWLLILGGIIGNVVNGNRFRRDKIGVENCLSKLATTTINQVSGICV
jgi:choice-of-anchor A domain-containing protein